MKDGAQLICNQRLNKVILNLHPKKVYRVRICLSADSSQKEGLIGLKKVRLLDGRVDFPF